MLNIFYSTAELSYIKKLQKISEKRKLRKGDKLDGCINLVIEMSNKQFATRMKKGHFPTGVTYHVTSSISISKSTRKLSFPDKLILNGNLVIDKCHELEVIPRHIHATGTVIISSCPKLQLVSSDITAESLRIHNCETFKTLQGKIEINELYIECPEFETLKGKFKIGNILNIRESNSFKYLPDQFDINTFHVGKTIIIYQCTNFSTAPPWFTEMEPSTPLTIFLYNSNLPENIRHKLIETSTKTPNISFDFTTQNPRLTTSRSKPSTEQKDTLPESKHAFRDGLLRSIARNSTKSNVSLNSQDSGYSSDQNTSPQLVYNTRTRERRNPTHNLRDGLLLSIANMNENSPTNFNLSPPTRRHEHNSNSNTTSNTGERVKFTDFNQAFNFWVKITGSKHDTPDLSIFNDIQINQITYYLEQLTFTAEFRSPTRKTMLAHRAVNLIKTLSKNDNANSDLISSIMDLIDHATSTCDDLIIINLDKIELLIETLDTENTAIQNNHPDDLIVLAKKMMNMERLYKIATEHLKRIPYLDPVEVHLAYETGFRNIEKSQQTKKKGFMPIDGEIPLLPGNTKNMKFRRISGVTDDHIRSAVREVQQACTQENLQRYLENWKPWDKFKRSQEVIPYENLPALNIQDIQENCPISYEKSSEMVMVDSYQLDFNSLKRIHINTGIHPITRKPIDWSNVKKLKPIP